MIRKVEKAKSISDVRPKIATLERLYIEYAKGFNESEDTDAKSAKGKLGYMNTLGYFDVFKKADLLRILPESVLKDLKRSQHLNLEKFLSKTSPKLCKSSSRTIIQKPFLWTWMP